MLYTIEGIVIRSFDYGESNKIITLFTRESGKAAVMARGARKTQSRHTAIAQLFTVGLYTFYLSRSGTMGTLNSGELVESHHALRSDLHMAAYASYIAELTDRLVSDDSTYPHLFDQLAAALNSLEEGKDARIIANVYELKMLEIAGYTPVFDECVSCCVSTDADRLPGTPANPSDPIRGTISAVMGGWLCPRCRERDSHALPVSTRTLQLLRLLQSVDLRKLGSIQVKEERIGQIRRVIRLFFDTYLDVVWKSRRFLEQLEKHNI
jgi:DNA repair protein RecO (recombination protein O)